jgi:hypothetical protein
MTKTKAKQPTVEDCEEILRSLERRREALISRGALLPQMRRDAAYEARVKGDAEARKALDSVATELAGYDTELASIDDAITAAKNRVLVAKALEADVADRARAREAVEILVVFKKAGHDLGRVLINRGL